MQVLEKFSSLSAEESICSSAVKTAFDTKAKLIVTVTECGKTARLVSKYHPACPILALTKDPQVRMPIQV
jgi:pyruvate kinase